MPCRCNDVVPKDITDYRTGSPFVHSYQNTSPLVSQFQPNAFSYCIIEIQRVAVDIMKGNGSKRKERNETRNKTELLLESDNRKRIQIPKSSETSTIWFTAENLGHRLGLNSPGQNTGITSTLHIPLRRQGICLICLPKSRISPYCI